MKDSTYFALRARRCARNAALLMMASVNLCIGGMLLHLYGFPGWFVIATGCGLALMPLAISSMADAFRAGSLCARWRGYEMEGRLSRGWEPPADNINSPPFSDGRPVWEGRSARVSRDSARR
jgi:hypothetical protein